MSESEVSIIIPNYNGLRLLKKHLPAVLTAARSNDELIIIDDCSTDESWNWLLQHFDANEVKSTKNGFDGEIYKGSWSVGKKKGIVKLLRNTLNKRFAISCNLAVEQATKPLIFLLNSDVSPHKNTIEKLTPHFEDPNVFAVGCLEHENGDEKLIGGKNTLEFKRGMFIHNRAPEFSSGETAWASGGSSMFDRQKWLDLGGFDQEYYPAYWEDVDLAFRAKQKGWKVLFDKDAEVDHNHESTNTSAFGQKKMKLMSWQHSHTFLHKHVTFWQRVQYFLWQPYWWMKMPYFAVQQLQFMFFLAILAITLISRGYLLGQVPHGIAWDEAAIGYNGLSVATTGRDEWLKKVPISFKSFGDYKAPLAIYIDGIFTFFLGINALSIRLPFFISSIFAVVGMIALTYVLWSEWIVDKERRSFPELSPVTAALLAGGLLATSSWHIHYSRIGFESGMALAFLIWGILGISVLLWKKLNASVWQKYLLGFLSAGWIAASLYTYHSSKIVAPLLLVMIAVLFRRKIFKRLPGIAMWCFALGVLLLPLAYDTFLGQGGSRFSQTSIFTKDASMTEVATTFVQHTVAQFSPKYLVGGFTPTLRHGDGKWGVLYVTELGLGLVAIVSMIAFTVTKNKKLKLPTGLFIFALAWILIGTVPAVIGIDVPHSNRALLAYPGFIFLTILGWQSIAQFFTKRENDLWAPAVLGTILLIHFFLFASYMHHYFTVFAKESADAFSDGYIEAMEYVYKHEPEVQKVLVTGAYKEALIYTLIARKTDVWSYNYGSLIKYEFRDEIKEGDLFRAKTIIVATPEEIDPEKGQYHVYGSDGKMRFVIVQTPDTL